MEMSEAARLPVPSISHESAREFLVERAELIFVSVVPFSYWLHASAYGFLVPLAFVVSCLFALPRIRRWWIMPMPDVALVVGLVFTAALAAYAIREISTFGLVDTQIGRMFMMPMVLVAIFVFVVRPTPLAVHASVRYLLIVNGVCLVAEALLVNGGWADYRASPAYHSAANYQPAPGHFIKPYGLTGNFSVNGVVQIYLLVLAWFFAGREGKRLPAWAILLSTLAIAVSGSGQAYFLALILIGYVVVRQRGALAKTVALCVLLGLLDLAAVGEISKLSPNYLADLQRVLETQWLTQSVRMDAAVLFFGTRTGSWQIDVFPAFAIGNMGVAYCLILGLGLAAGFAGYRRFLMILAFLFICIGSLHYPTVFYFHAQVITAMVAASGLLEAHGHNSIRWGER